jgi:hypothetical protein
MMTKLDMGGVREERFEGLMYHQGTIIRYERVKGTNSCAGILIFGFCDILRNHLKERLQT